MDAISFATGARAASLRVKQLRELIHGARIGHPVAKTARVTIRYRDDEEHDTSFRRSISGDSSEYHINGEHVTHSKYMEELEKVNILAKAQNCLVFQAEKYQAVLDELYQKRLQLGLMELYHNERTIHKLSDDLKEKQQTAAAKTSTVKTWEQKVKTLKKEHGCLSREQQHIDKELCTQEHILSQCMSKYIKAKINSSHHMKKAEELRTKLKKNQKLVVIKEQELVEGQQEIIEMEKTWRKYERQEQEVTRGRDIELDQDQFERYKELKEVSRKQTAVLRQQVDRLHWEVKANYAKIALDQRRRKEVEVAIRNNHTELEDLTHRAEKLEEYTKTCQSATEEYCQQEKNLSTELRQVHQRSEEVKQDLRQVVEELENASLDSHESRRQLRRKELLEKLHRLYPDTVYGRLCDLCSPIHKKYQLAVTKVFGHFMNSVVVASEKVARDCIQFTKEELFEPETFLPVSYLDVHPLNERLREMTGVKMVVDVVQVNTPTLATQMKKVIQFVCGNALVCETIKEARSVAFGRLERYKTVSLDGTLFSKSGVISGGSRDLQRKAYCWDEKEMRKLKERKDQLMAELSELMKLRRKESDLKQVIAQAQGAQTRLKYSNAELDNIRKNKILRCQADISHLESDLTNLDSEIQMQEDSVDVKAVEMKKIRDQINQMEDLVFSDFCAEIKVDSIREYEQEHVKQQTEQEKKRLQFEAQVAYLNAQLEYGQEWLEQQKKELHHTREAMDKEQKAVVEHRKDEEKLLAAVEVNQNNILDLKNQLLAKENQVLAAKTELDQKIQTLQEINKELVKLQQKVMSVETAWEQKCLSRHNLLLDCKIQGLPITLLSGSLDEITQVQLDSESGSTGTTMDLFEREAQLIIDYSVLQEEFRNLQDDEEVNSCLEKLKDSVTSIEEVLNRTAVPNLKALEKMREVREKLHGLMEAFDASSKESRKCSQEFEEIKGRRCQLFSQCFEHVSVAVDHIYKSICRNSSAQAILSAENPEEPYLGGISYNCVAPGKRFMSMDNLSGGEKALAALALVFAIHSFRPAPFLILDEVDAALDNSNIGKVTSFIRHESSRNMQIITISLKEEFFSKADALLGVYSDVDECMCMFSHILTLDLRAYPEVEEDGRKQTDTSQDSQSSA
ncbi:structural maintenance of chromosomes protein 1B isoform X2 [Sphaeramia orbicularis]|uniref:structural maintenance of chromosomes protein 1B isoform X2 n=1 Tax=Sphaeramia orbicularis TaxID=375764 RepID=UPI00117E6B5E|nr:structural maintenance of chromosomes protein 1B-like isoform X2 [Sphaeramia orbicularis]